MVNIQSKINKLMLAIQSKGRAIKINTEQFYSKEKQRMFTCYIISEITPKKYEIKDRIKKMKKDKADKEEIDKLKLYVENNYISGTIKFYKKLDILLFLVEFWKEKVNKNGG